MEITKLKLQWNKCGNIYCSKDVVSVTKNEFCVGSWRDFKFQSTDVDVTTECPEVWLLHAVDTVQL